MNVTQMISELRDERAALDDAIAVLERLASSRRRGRGRPPSWMSSITATATAAAGASEDARPRRMLSPATRRKMAESQRKRWEAYRKSHESS